MSGAEHSKLIILAGATGNLGQRIARELIDRGAAVRALVREGVSTRAIAALRGEGATIVEVNYNDEAQLMAACSGGMCVVSALSGLREVIVDTQSRLLSAATAAGVPRFIPSDYCIDFTKLPAHSNRNLDMRRDFGRMLDASPITATSILNGMFADLLTGQAPFVLFRIKRVLYWGNADQLMDFTTMDDAAAFTAAAALDPSTPRYLRIAGDVKSARGLCKAASDATGESFKLLRPGGLRRLKVLIAIVRTLFPQRKAVFPPWQGMQYMYDMFDGRAKLEPLNNDRYEGIRWTSVDKVLKRRSAESGR